MTTVLMAASNVIPLRGVQGGGGGYGGVGVLEGNKNDTVSQQTEYGHMDRKDVCICT